MAEDLTAVTTFPHMARFATGSANDLTQIQLPTKATKVTVLFESNDGKVTHTGTDAAAIGAEFFTVPADAALEMQVGLGISATPPLSIFVTSATGTTSVCVILEGQVDMEVD